jgi:hypothetical protein
MQRVYDLQHQGTTIFCLDISGFQLADKPEFHRLVDQAKERIRSARPKSLLVITNVTNTGFDSDVARTIKAYAEHNTPYVKASAVVGISGLQKVVLTAVKTLTKREFHLADTMDEAIEWLVRQS